MRKSTLLAFAFLFARFAGAVELASYEVTVRVAGDGSGKGSAVVRLENAVPGRIAIPLGFANVASVSLTLGPEGTEVSATPLDGHTVVAIVLPQGAPQSVEIAFNFPTGPLFVDGNGRPGERRTLPEGSRMLGLRLMNSQPAPVSNYDARVIFPDGMRAHAIRESLPKLGKSEVGPRVQLGEIDSRPGATLHVDRLLQGESASMKLELVSTSRSPGWLIVGALLSILYLIYFRDLVARRAE